MYVGRTDIVWGDTNLVAEYDAAFTAPYSLHRWRSKRARRAWSMLEGWQDSLAGPLTSIINTGGCAYVYERGDTYFKGVTDPATLRARMLSWHDSLAAGVERFAPRTGGQWSDLGYMRSLVVQMRALVEWGCEVERQRFEASKT